MPYSRVNQFPEWVLQWLQQIPQLLQQILKTYWILIGTACFVLVFSIIVFWASRRKQKMPVRKETEVSLAVPLPTEQKLPIRVERSISDVDADRAKSSLRMLEVERDIISSALTRLYDEEKLSEAERSSLAVRYREDLRRVEEQISLAQIKVQLYDLERSETELVKSFYDKLNEIKSKTAEARSRLGAISRGVAVSPSRVEEEPKSNNPPTANSVAVEKPPVPEFFAPSPAPPRTKAEEKIEKIRAEVLKELERLEQMEIQE